MRITMRCKSALVLFAPEVAHPADVAAAEWRTGAAEPAGRLQPLIAG